MILLVVEVALLGVVVAALAVWSDLPTLRRGARLAMSTRSTAPLASRLATVTRTPRCQRSTCRRVVRARGDYCCDGCLRRDAEDQVW